MKKVFLFFVLALATMSVAQELAKNIPDSSHATQQVEFKDWAFDSLKPSIGPMIQSGTDDCYLNFACSPDSVKKLGRGVICVNGAATMNFRNNKMGDDTLRMGSAYHYLFNDQGIAYYEGDYIEFVGWLDYQSSQCGEAVAPPKKVVHFLARIDRRDYATDQIFYTIVDYYGDYDMVVDIMEYGWRMSIPDSTPVIVIGHPRDAMNLHLKTAVRGKSGHVVRSELGGRFDWVVISRIGEGRYGSGSSGSAMLDFQGRDLGVLTSGTTCAASNLLPTIAYFPGLSNDPRIREYLGADSLNARTRQLFIKRKNPPAVVFKKVEATSSYNRTKVTVYIDCLFGQTSLDLECASNDSFFVKVKTIKIDKVGSYTFLDTLDYNANVKYRVKAINGWRYNVSQNTASVEVRVPWESTSVDRPTEVDKFLPVAPTGLVLANYPNPFNATTTICYKVVEAGPVSLQIFNSTGQMVTDLVNKNLLAGVYQAFWNAGNMASGAYFSRLVTLKGVETRKIILKK